MPEIDKDKRVSLEGLAAVYDDIKDNRLGGLKFYERDGLLYIDDDEPDIDSKDTTEVE